MRNLNYDNGTIQTKFFVHTNNKLLEDKVNQWLLDCKNSILYTNYKMSDKLFGCSIIYKVK